MRPTPHLQVSAPARGAYRAAIAHLDEQLMRMVAWGSSPELWKEDRLYVAALRRFDKALSQLCVAYAVEDLEPRTIARWAYGAADAAAARVRRLEESGTAPGTPIHRHAWEQMVELHAIAREAFHVAARGVPARALRDTATETTQVVFTGPTGGVS